MVVQGNSFVIVHGFNGSRFNVGVMKEGFDSVSNKELIRFCEYIM